MSVDIKDLDKADVLAALYNAARPQGLGFMHYNPAPMTAGEARSILADSQTYFDYLKGRVMKIDLSGDSFSAELYDRDNGAGAAQRVIEALRVSGSVRNATILDQHMAATRASLQDAREHLGDPTVMLEREEAPNLLLADVKLGLADVAHRLKPKLDNAEKALG